MQAAEGRQVASYALSAATCAGQRTHPKTVGWHPNASRRRMAQSVHRLRSFRIGTKASSPRKTLPESPAWLFPEYEFGKMNPRTHRYAIMERILERGTWSEVNWLFDTCGEKRCEIG